MFVKVLVFFLYFSQVIAIAYDDDDYGDFHSISENLSFTPNKSDIESGKRKEEENTSGRFFLFMYFFVYSITNILIFLKFSSNSC